MVQHVLSELHDFRGAHHFETSDWVLQVSLCVSVSAPLVYLACGLFCLRPPSLLLRIRPAVSLQLQVTVRERGSKV